MKSSLRRQGSKPRPICGKKYGKRRQFTCKKDPNHKGQHGRRIPLHRIL